MSVWRALSVNKCALTHLVPTLAPVTLALDSPAMDSAAQVS